MTFNPETAADAWLGLLAMRGVDYLFANGGTDFAPVVEAYAKGEKLGWRCREIVIVPHENMGVAMAHGYAMVTGRPQAMMVHVGVGTANALNGLINASRTEHADPLHRGAHADHRVGRAARGAQQLHPLGAGALRPGRHAARVHEVGLRAAPSPSRSRRCSTARSRSRKSEPQGPVYVTLPREVLASGFSARSSRRTRRSQAASAPAADPEALEEAAKLLGSAQADRCSSPRTAAARSRARAPSSSWRRRSPCR